MTSKQLLSMVCACFISASAQQSFSDRTAQHSENLSFAARQKRGTVVYHPSGDTKLQGTLYLPDGKGPFPAPLWKDGAEKNPVPQPELAAFHSRHGFALFTPLRRGHGPNTGKDVDDLLKPAIAAHTSDLVGYKRFVQLLEQANHDVSAAFQWLGRQPSIRREQIFMSGVSYGGLHTLFSADELDGVRGFIVFSGGARLWANPILQQRLYRAVRNAKSPIFLLHAANDYGTEPAIHLGPLLAAKGLPSHAKIYAAFGNPADIRMGHISFATWNLGIEVSGSDVLDFMEQALRSEPQQFRALHG